MDKLVRQAVSVEEVAEILGVSRSMAYSLCSGGRIKTVKAGRSTLVPLISITEFLNPDASR
jgi:excisionase family DNA binding protein